MLLNFGNKVLVLHLFGVVFIMISNKGFHNKF